MSKKPTITKPSNQLLEALTFCSCVSEKLGAPHETHISLRNNMAIAFNGIIAAGHPITEDCTIHAHTLLLIEALSRCSENYSLTQLDNGRLSIKSGKFKVIVPCLPEHLMQSAEPDPQIVGITNRFREAVEAVGVLASETAQHVLTASVLMAGPSVISTNRVVLLEFWHGLDLPPGIALPKAFVAALVKIKRNLVGFGFSKSSATFHFEGGAWIRTQLYNDTWPDVSSILNRKANLWPIDPNFWEALKAIEPFSDDGNCYSEINLIKSHADEAGASHECSGIPKGFVYPIKQLMLLKGWCKRIDWMASGVHDSSYCLVAEGDEQRAVISGRQKT